ncbi:dihydrofolate reductase family protein [Phytomonospora sp. NPDC050363]|uniref:RibD family protein n=1 Tax=Phytomonospora sp. NPDC050363 TaxID=3155642 RepID=UPI0033DB34C8
MPNNRPYVLLSAAVSLDGHLDDTSPERLILSTPADLDRVREVRAGSDAILVGASTIRRDNPALTAGDAGRCPMKVTVTGTGDLDPSSRFFTVGSAQRLVYATTPALPATRRRLDGLATVVDGGQPVSWPGILADLRTRGVVRLMVEGGGTIHTQLLTAGLVDEIQLAIAPFFVGESEAPRFVGPGLFPFGKDRRMRLTEVRRLDDLAVLRYQLRDEDE